MEGRIETGSEFVPDALRARLRGIGRLAVAFSGGTDSAYLLYAAKACGCEVKAYTIASQFQPAFERRDAAEFAEALGVPAEVIKVDILAREAVAQNPADRCYHCKRALFETLIARARADGFEVLADGTNASDDATDRPGMRALRELGVVSPLRESGITKAQVRERSRQANLPTWDKPAYACLATRIQTGVPIDRETLARVEKAENALFALGFFDLRVRVRGREARLQLTEAQMPRLIERRREVLAALSEDFPEIALDLRARAGGD